MSEIINFVCLLVYYLTFIWMNAWTVITGIREVDLNHHVGSEKEEIKSSLQGSGKAF